MSDAAITAAEIEQYCSHVGLTAEHADTVDPHVALQLAATLDADVPDQVLPPLWHYGLFQTSVGTAALDIDGHPKRGDFLPPVRLPRRMFAAAALKFIKPLTIGQDVSRLSRVSSVDHRSGKTGALVFVRVAITLSQAGSVCVEEEQTIAYRPAGGSTPAVKIAPWLPLKPGDAGEIWLPTTKELFRYSAATFNTHRIHYDQSYATETEGYPDLVVHGPLIATRLCAFAAKVAGGELADFAFRGKAPSFVGQELRLTGAKTNETVAVRIERGDGVVAMSATATVR